MSQFHAPAEGNGILLDLFMYGWYNIFLWACWRFSWVKVQLILLQEGPFHFNKVWLNEPTAKELSFGYCNCNLNWRLAQSKEEVQLIDGQLAWLRNALQCWQIMEQGRQDRLFFTQWSIFCQEEAQLHLLANKRKDRSGSWTYKCQTWVNYLKKRNTLIPLK